MTKHIKVKSWRNYINKHPDFTGCLINPIGDKAWLLNGKYHRDNGPAMEWSDGNNWWFLNGEEYSEQEHRRLVRQIKLKLLDDYK